MRADTEARETARRLREHAGEWGMQRSPRATEPDHRALRALLWPLCFSDEQHTDGTANNFECIIYIYFSYILLSPYLQAVVPRGLKHDYS